MPVSNVLLDRVQMVQIKTLEHGTKAQLGSRSSDKISQTRPN
jgi:hypothetical protein